MQWTILIVDDRELTRLGLRTLFASQRGLIVVGEAATLGEAITHAVRLHPMIVITETRLPDGTGIDVCRKVRDAMPAARVIILSDFVEDEAVAAAVRVGVAGYLSTRLPVPQLVAAVRAVADGETRFGLQSRPSLVENLRRHAVSGVPRDILAVTPQERRVLALVAQGKTNKEIGHALGLSEKTVKNYLSRAFEKLNVGRRAQAAVVFARGDYVRGAERLPDMHGMTRTA